MISYSISELICIVDTLIESEKNPDYDYSSLLALGFTKPDLLAFKSILRQIQTTPSLVERELAESSEAKLAGKLGGLNMIKLALGIDQGELTPFTKSDRAEQQNGLCLKYPMFLRFANAIKSDDGSVHQWLLRNLTVEFENGLLLQSIPLTSDKSVAIPSNDQEAALVGAALLSNRYQLLAYDARSCLMSLLCLMDQRIVTIEVRCLSSTLSNHPYDAFCVENDLETTSPAPRRRIVWFTEQIRKRLK